MSRYVDIAEGLLQAIADGALQPGAALPSVRALARREGTTPATAGRAYAELARAGAIVSAPRRVARVAPDGAARARARLTGTRPLRLAGSDDPLLDLLVAAAAGHVERAAPSGSFGGLTALWRGQADAATLHLWHARGYNAPYAARILAGREPVLVHLWRREQGIVVPPGNPRGIGTIDDLARVTTALRAPGTGPVPSSIGCSATGACRRSRPGTGRASRCRPRGRRRPGRRGVACARRHHPRARLRAARLGAVRARAAGRRVGARRSASVGAVRGRSRGVRDGRTTTSAAPGAASHV